MEKEEVRGRRKEKEEGGRDNYEIRHIGKFLSYKKKT